jgi:membrane associated rhomboid family serine protease
MTDPPDSPGPPGLRLVPGPPEPPPEPPADFDPVADFEPYDDPPDADDAAEPTGLWERVGDVHPGLTYGIVLAVLVAFAAELVGAWSHTGDLWATGSLASPAIDRGAAAWTAIRAGEWWRPLSSLFLHANALHVGSNLIALVVGGGVAERVFGHSRFLLLFTLVGLAGAAASCAHQAVLAAHGAPAYGSIGASGAVYGVGAAVVAAAVRLRGLIAPWRARALVGATMPLLLSSLVAGLARPEVDNAAHAGGALAGLLLGFVLPLSGKLTQRAEPAAARILWATLGGLSAILLIVSAGIAFGLPRPL